jgi:hypothetical protein
MVPSAMPAASAIWRVVTPEPCRITSGRAASMIAVRRSAGAMRGARRFEAGTATQ